jgi:glycosyltransferase involved in cell wall biosynthesis
MNNNLKNPLVSIIIPTYNRAWIVKTAIDSVLDQDYPHTEIIVIDDGSYDNTRELLQAYDGSIVVLEQENKGVSAARNLGIQKAKGELIALLDSDDAWDKRKLSCQVESFKENPKAMICQTEEIWIRNGRRVNPKRKHQKPSGMIFEKSLHLCLVSPSAVMMRRTLFDKKGLFNEQLPVCEDYDLWLRVSCDTQVFLIDRPYTIKQGGHEDQLSGHHSQDKYRIKAIINLLNSSLLTEPQKKAAITVLRKKCEIYVNGCIKRGKSKEGEKYIKLIQGFVSG